MPVVQKTSVIVSAVSPPGRHPDLMAVGLADEVRRRTDGMELVEDRVLEPKEVGPALSAMDPSAPCALVLVGRFTSTEVAAARWLEKYPHLVVAKVPIAIVNLGPTRADALAAVKVDVTTAHALPALADALAAR